jgi:hypothetical protein
MKAIFGGYLYDTDKAEFIVSWESADRTDCINRLELYRTASGRYFVYRINYVPGEDSAPQEGIVRPMTELEAIQWAEIKFSVEKVLEIFGDKIREA